MAIFYQTSLKKFSRELRKHSTLAEILLWNELKQRKIKGYQFYRQKPLLNYIVDFYCPAVKLVIELDGNYHNQSDQSIKDDARQKQLEAMGLNFLRFGEREVEVKRGLVIERIEEYIEDFESGKDLSDYKI